MQPLYLKYEQIKSDVTFLKMFSNPRAKIKISVIPLTSLREQKTIRFCEVVLCLDTDALNVDTERITYVAFC